MSTAKIVEKVCPTCSKTFRVDTQKRHPDVARFCGMDCYRNRSLPSLADRFWEKVDKSNPEGCWLWIGAHTPLGYGVFSTGSGRADNSQTTAHRVAWKLTHGEWPPKGMHICHRCDVRLCCRPDHLFLGTAADNIHDMHAKGRNRSPDRQGSKNSQSKLTEEKVREIRRRWAAGEVSQKQLGLDYGVTDGLIWQIVNRYAWKHVE